MSWWDLLPLLPPGELTAVAPDGSLYGFDCLSDLPPSTPIVRTGSGKGRRYWGDLSDMEKRYVGVDLEWHRAGRGWWHWLLGLSRAHPPHRLPPGPTPPGPTPGSN